jgi:Big-like domain-containing protein
VPGLIASISVIPGRDTLVLARTGLLSATALDAVGNQLTGYTVTWASTDSAVARVSATGLVTTVSLGVDTIAATAGGRAGVAVLTVAPLITVSPRLPSLFAGDTVQLAASVTDANGAAHEGDPADRSGVARRRRVETRTSPVRRSLPEPRVPYRPAGRVRPAAGAGNRSLQGNPRPRLEAKGRAASQVKQVHRRECGHHGHHLQR